jgi:hypothetical protein
MFVVSESDAAAIRSAFDQRDQGPSPVLSMITYSVLRLPARRTEPWTEIPIAGIRAGERKTC